VWWALCAIVGLLILLPTYVLLNGSNAAFEDSATQAVGQTDQYNTLAQTLERTNTQAELLVRNSNATSFSSMIQDVKIAAPNSVAVTAINFVSASNEEVITQISIGGVAGSRQSLADFRDALQALDYIEEVELPISNLASSEDINFNLTAVLGTRI
jgi:hypothetical protein